MAERTKVECWDFLITMHDSAATCKLTDAQLAEMIETHFMATLDMRSIGYALLDEAVQRIDPTRRQHNERPTNET